MHGAYILFDIGGTKMRFTSSFDGKTFGEPKIIPTPKDFEDGMEIFCASARELSRGKKISAVAGGVAGTLDRARAVLVNSPNISGWVKKPLKEKLERDLGAPVYIENDTAVVGLGEAAVGAGKGFGIVVYVTVSTGVGGARIVGGKIDKSVFGFEAGHQIIDFHDSSGRLEGYISGAALERRSGKKPREITDEKIWDEEAQILAVGLHNSIAHWSPDIVVLGGSMVVKRPGISVDRVREYLQKIKTAYPEFPEIREATLGDVGGLWGALSFLNQRI
ncbi:MAG: hypothetical protein A3F26_01595 [Candidatus Ryanbacteria bacterium RIFCSPHIGHO2_12_FULL_47_12b]|uniref:ROK family protein n=3 Tax=Parcubacteria group TaxID=1794811 RepID=A0A1G2H554_9BACT|nr:MAG: hypothetical protein UX74_C0013G0009 [Parcubacteria group bacterium GW2011_GWA2_47_10b]KKU75409.1 MAG: hypothetical protein UY02_C0052G0010 [Candidatus Giovannonibacteria bacterium GW2011_GWB1_47_6b]KKU86323.1 MAG: hypothetical protein UY14_C0003G0019 [Parcubacteria group bacterium GW2011_GWA1_47_9]OGZ45614.1 MAG: hypothetical protein A2844_00970 [Candidatus Ryanbacteria bacterium RIFCSPHIGHO2_01_FULL_48_80]OGZ50047.1 MAG: hypothetical protein A3C83_03350 [Candidatus Ryanbacteria bacter